jgi:hypothetical protein
LLTSPILGGADILLLLCARMFRHLKGFVYDMEE